MEGFHTLAHKQQDDPDLYVAKYLHFPARLAELGFPMDRLKVELLRGLGSPLR
jgi:hypothetical protein